MRNSNFEFGRVVQEKMPFKNSSYLELCRPFCAAEGNLLCTFGRGHHEVHFCEIILNLDTWFRRRCGLENFLSGALAALLFSGARPFVPSW